MIRDTLYQYQNIICIGTPQLDLVSQSHLTLSIWHRYQCHQWYTETLTRRKLRKYSNRGCEISAYSNPFTTSTISWCWSRPSGLYSKRTQLRSIHNTHIYLVQLYIKVSIRIYYSNTRIQYKYTGVWKGWGKRVCNWWRNTKWRKRYWNSGVEYHS